MLTATPTTTLPITATRLVHEVLVSNYLGREVALSILVPTASSAGLPLPVLYLNDGQDLERLALQNTLDALYAAQAVRPFLLVAIHANEARVQEYGTASQADFSGRGSRARAYTNFVLHELLPFAQAQYGASPDPAAAVMAGFSLGGLSAFDIVWHHPEALTRAGVFSGSFWWRHRALDAGYTPADRIMHGLVRSGRLHPSHRFWLQTGTLDERNDRNENGVIDSMEDCLDLMAGLVAAGLNANTALRYVQVEGGHHHPDTWGQLMPDFLVWAFGQEGSVAALPAPLPVVRLQLDPAAPTAQPLSEENAAEAEPAIEGAEPVVSSIDQLSPQSAGIASGLISPIMSIIRPAEGDFLPYAATYINQVPAGADPLETLRGIGSQFHAIFDGMSEAQAAKSYAPGKWNLKEMLQHQIDTERVFAYRAMRFARADGQDLPGFDQDAYVANSGANARTVASLLAEYDATRASTLALFSSFTEEQLARRGSANGGPATVRALAYIVPGHELHHLHLIRERYLPIL